MSTTDQKPCNRCRARKQKCDRTRPQCGYCCSRKLSDCTYETGQGKQRRKQLTRGAACVRCSTRAKKKRCDAGSPCSTCEKAGKQNECIYQETSRYSRSAKLLESDKLSAERQPKALPPSNAVTLPPRSRLPSIKPKLGSPSSSALSHVSPDDMNMIFRLLFLVHKLQFGFCLKLSKQAAIHLGDLEDSTVPPFFIHFAHMMGCYIFQERRNSFSLVHTQALHLNLCLNSLSAMKEDDDPVALAQAYHSLALACLYTHIPHSAMTFVEKALDIIDRHDIRCVPLKPCPSERAPDGSLILTEDVVEVIILLTQLLYSEVNRLLVYGKSENRCLHIEKQFREEVEVAYPLLFDICPITLRLKSLLFVKDARALMASSEKSLPTILPPFLTLLVAHIKRVDNRMSHFQKLEDEDRCISYRYSSIICQTTLAEAYNLLAGSPYITTDSSLLYRAKCSEALKVVVDLTRSQRPEDFSFLDPLLGTCWSRATALFVSEDSLRSSGSTAISLDTSKVINVGIEQSLGLKVVRPRAMCATLLGYLSKGYLTLPEVQIMYPQKISVPVAS